MLKDRKTQFKEIKEHLLKAQERMKYYADKKRKEKELAVGDWVYLKLQPFRQKSLPRSRSHKLSPRYAGPFLVTERIGPVAYRLKFPEHSRIHNVFHIVLLKKKVGENEMVMELPEFDGETPKLFEPEAVLDRGMRRAKGKSIPEVLWLIKWKELPEDEATWEAAGEIRQRFPEFQP